MSPSLTRSLSLALSISLSRTSKCPRTRESREIVSSRAAIDVDDEDEDGGRSLHVKGKKFREGGKVAGDGDGRGNEQ